MAVCGSPCGSVLVCAFLIVFFGFPKGFQKEGFWALWAQGLHAVYGFKLCCYFCLHVVCCLVFLLCDWAVPRVCVCLLVIWLLTILESCLLFGCLLDCLVMFNVIVFCESLLEFVCVRLVDQRVMLRFCGREECEVLTSILESYSPKSANSAKQGPFIDFRPQSRYHLYTWSLRDSSAQLCTSP